MGKHGNSKGGARGGRDQFSWDSVQGDKYKDFYLGHSLKAKHNALFWKPKNVFEIADKSGVIDKKATEDKLREERERIRKQEEELMQEALGLKPKKRRVNEIRLEKHEVQQLLSRSTPEEAGDEGGLKAERVAGLGYAEAPTHDVSILPKRTRSDPSDELDETKFEATTTEEDTKGRRRRDDDGGGDDDDEKRRRDKKKEKEKKKDKSRDKHHSRSSTSDRDRDRDRDRYKKRDRDSDRRRDY